jgi:hypothetical protein
MLMLILIKVASETEVYTHILRIVCSPRYYPGGSEESHNMSVGAPAEI